MIDAFLSKLANWCKHDETIRAVILVGSHARGCAHADSDIDLVLIVDEPKRFFENFEWANAFGKVTSLTVEDWGLVRSLRVEFEEGLETEFGFTSQEWCQSEQIADGTGRVIADGAKIIYDPNDIAKRLLQAVQEWSDKL